MKDKYLPDMYYKDIYSINYKKLKNKGIKLLIFDFDNTIVDKDGIITKRIIDFFNNLRKSFNIIIISNTFNPKRLKNFAFSCNLKYVSHALKPLKIGYIRINKKKRYLKSEVAAVGDQLLTDIVGAKKMGYTSILVDKIGIDDTSFTKINRYFEDKIYKKINFERGKYYD